MQPPSELQKHTAQKKNIGYFSREELARLQLAINRVTEIKKLRSGMNPGLKYV